MQRPCQASPSHRHGCITGLPMPPCGRQSRRTNGLCGSAYPQGVMAPSAVLPQMIRPTEILCGTACPLHGEPERQGNSFASRRKVRWHHVARLVEPGFACPPGTSLLRLPPHPAVPREPRAAKATTRKPTCLFSGPVPSRRNRGPARGQRTRTHLPALPLPPLSRSLSLFSAYAASGPAPLAHSPWP